MIRALVSSVAVLCIGLSGALVVTMDANTKLEERLAACQAAVKSQKADALEADAWLTDAVKAHPDLAVDITTVNGIIQGLAERLECK